MKLPIGLAKVLVVVGRIPGVGPVLRWWANRFPEGSVVTIPYGCAAGFKWKRHHRYVNSFWLGQTEILTQETVVRELKEGERFFDVGSHAGFFTLIASRRVGPQGRCVAFEPSPVNVESIREQLALNEITNCEVIEAAVSESGGRARLSFDLPGSACAHLGAPDAGERVIEVKTITLDEACATWGPPSFIKMDIEGAESAALRGATNLLREHRPGFVIEIHSPGEGERVREILARNGYRFLDLNGRELAAGAALPHYVLAKAG